MFRLIATLVLVLVPTLTAAQGPSVLIGIDPIPATTPATGPTALCGWAIDTQSLPTRGIASVRVMYRPASGLYERDIPAVLHLPRPDIAATIGPLLPGGLQDAAIGWCAPLTLYGATPADTYTFTAIATALRSYPQVTAQASTTATIGPTLFSWLNTPQNGTAYAPGAPVSVRGVGKDANQPIGLDGLSSATVAARNAHRPDLPAIPLGSLQVNQPHLHPAWNGYAFTGTVSAPLQPGVYDLFVTVTGQGSPAQVSTLQSRVVVQ